MIVQLKVLQKSDWWNVTSIGKRVFPKLSKDEILNINRNNIEIILNRVKTIYLEVFDREIFFNALD
jgi:hypothetical protein